VILSDTLVNWWHRSFIYALPFNNLLLGDW